MATETPDPKSDAGASHGPQSDGTGAGWALIGLLVTILIAVAVTAEAM